MVRPTKRVATIHFRCTKSRNFAFPDEARVSGKLDIYTSTVVIPFSRGQFRHSRDKGKNSGSGVAYLGLSGSFVTFLR